MKTDNLCLISLWARQLQLYFVMKIYYMACILKCTDLVSDMFIRFEGICGLTVHLVKDTGVKQVYAILHHKMSFTLVWIQI